LIDLDFELEEEPDELEELTLTRKSYSSGNIGWLDMTMKRSDIVSNRNSL